MVHLKGNNFGLGAVVAQLVERLLPTPDDRGSNPIVGVILLIYSLSTVLKRLK